MRDSSSSTRNSHRCSCNNESADVAFIVDRTGYDAHDDEEEGLDNADP